MFEVELNINGQIKGGAKCSTQMIFDTEKKEELLKVLMSDHGLEVEKVESDKIGNVSDGYHTFNELYYHRTILFALICHLCPDITWKSKRHFDNEKNPMFDGMFIVGINTPDGGYASYHCDLPYWDVFDCKELERAPKWDGSTPAQDIEKIKNLITALKL